MAVLFIFVIVGILSKYIYERRPGSILAYLVFFPMLLPKVTEIAGLPVYGHLVRVVFFLAVIIIYFKFYSRYYKEYDISVRFALITLVFAIIVFNILSDNRSSLMYQEYMYGLFFFTILPTGISMLVLNNELHIRQFVRSTNMWALLFIAYHFLFLELQNLDFSNRTSYNNISGLNTISSSRIFAIIFIINFVNFTFKKSVGAAVMICLSAYFILATGQRGTIIGLIMGVMSYFVLNRVGDGRSFFLLLFIGILINVISGFLDVQEIEVFDRFEELENIEEISRYADYFMSFNIFRSNYLFFGEGSQGYYFLTQRIYPHNIFLESMVEYGLIGLVSVVVLVVVGVRNCYFVLRIRANNLDKESLAICIIWIMLFFSVNVSGSFATNSIFIIVSLVLANRVRQIKNERMNLISEYSSFG